MDIKSLFGKNDELEISTIEIKNPDKFDPQTLRVFERYFVNKIPVLFTLVGLPGSGKSELAKNITYDKQSPVIHSSDELRKELYGDYECSDKNSELFAELHKRIKADLRAGKSVIYDATNLRKNNRIAFNQELKKIDCYKVCVCLMTPYEECIKRNNARFRKVPVSVIERMYKHWSPPALDEGYDDIILIYSYGDTEPSKYELINFFYGDIDAVYIDQKNKHHSLTIGDHCLTSARYMIKKYWEDVTNDGIDLVFAALLHDIGKPFTKSFKNYKGEIDGDCHYYNHENCGAYDSMFYTKQTGLSLKNIISVSNLIYYHMMPFTSFKQSERSMRRVRKQIGEVQFSKLCKLHEADLAAH